MLQTLWRPWPLLVRETPVAVTGSVMDAAGESTSYIGEIRLSSGPGTSKVLSSSGGKIYFAAASVTFANASSNLRVGVQDVSTSTGVEDGSYDVYDDLVPGTDTVTSDTIATATMSSGSKTIAHGDKVAVVIEWTARAGSDAMTPYRINVSSAAQANFPYCTADVGGGPAKTQSLPAVTIEFDDGTIGTFGPQTALSVAGTANVVSFNSGSTPDEYAMIFQVPFRCEVAGLIVGMGEIDATEDGELILYSDPLGTPAVQRTITIDPDIVSLAVNATGLSTFQCAGFTCESNVTYAVAYRPTSTGARALQQVVLPSANARLLTTPFGTSLQGGSRTDQTGAFGSLSTTTVPFMGLLISKLEDGHSVRAAFSIGV